MKSLPIILLFTVCMIYGCGNTGNHEHQHDGTEHTHDDESHSHDDDGHSHDNDGAHSHGVEYTPPEVILDSKVIPATNNSPEYIQMATNIEIVESVAAAATSPSSVFTHEGYFAPVLFGEELRTFSLKLEPGMFLAEHPHPTESLVYTISGQWVLCSEGKRQVMKAGSVFHFGSNMPTGWEAPFEGGALLLICKKIRKNENYDFFTEGTRTLAKELDEDYKAGGKYYYHQLADDHPAIQFARKQNPDFDALVEKSKMAVL